jgi:hypothetical protein
LHFYWQNVFQPMKFTTWYSSVVMTKSGHIRRWCRQSKDSPVDINNADCLPATSRPSTLQSRPWTIRLPFMWATKNHCRSWNFTVMRKWKLLFINGCICQGPMSTTIRFVKLMPKWNTSIYVIENYYVLEIRFLQWLQHFSDRLNYISFHNTVNIAMCSS